MALTPRLELRQSQTLVMTPQLQQAIKLLQLSNLELTSFVGQEVERNPLLEWEGSDDTGSGDTAAAGDESAAAPVAAQDGGEPGPLGVDTQLTEPGDMAVGNEAPLDTNFENLYNHDSAADTGPGDNHDSLIWSRVHGGAFDQADNRLEQSADASTSLRDHLLEQLPCTFARTSDQLIARYLIDLVNDGGYLSESPDAVAQRLGCSENQIEAVLTTLQTFNPTGVFARDLKECLALQLAEINRLDPVMQAFLEHLDLMAKHDLAALRRVCGVSHEDLSEMMDEIRALNPKPGAAFSAEPMVPMIPDVFLREKSDGGWSVELNSETLPRVLINRRYHAEISRTAHNSEDKTFLSECLASANWLVKALDQRARTILKVAAEIVRQQDAFFAKGVQYLRPLNLRLVAEAIEMHESTVSRVTANKYMATTRGIFELKYFFSPAISSSDGGEQHAAEAIRHRIRELVEHERVDNILSDDRMVEMLRRSGIDIARRTVAKYREAMGIPSSVQRRRMKKMGLGIAHAEGPADTVSHHNG